MIDRMGSRGRAEAWRPWVPAGRRPAWAWPDAVSNLARGAGRQLREWTAAEVAPGRLVPWLAIGFGSGIVIYFALDREPALWATAVLLVATITLAIVVRYRPVAFPVAVGLAALAAGFAGATFKCALIAHPVLTAPAWNVEIGGFVEAREERERSDRMIVRVERISGPRLNEQLERVRVSVRKGTAPAVGSFVAFTARLSPPLEPLRPGGYDFARDMYFQRIGASGFVVGSIRTVDAPRPQTLWLRYASALDGMREAIDKRIRAVLPGDKGAIASALITGKRDAISAPANEAMYTSSLAHVLSISGYHMAVVAGIMFFVFRALFALMGDFASRHPIKKWAALAALVTAAFYLLLSGAEVATQRSFIMIAIVLVGVMVDRQTLTFRTLTVAAFAVLLLAPEAVVHPSFQMSFAATLALIAGYQGGLPWLSKSGDTALASRIAFWGAGEVIGLVLVSLLAGTATIPYIAYHFHRVSPYGVIANLLAMPVVSILVTPAGILGLLVMPLGLDAPCWHVMGYGIDWMVAIALWVTSLPGALGRVAAFGAGPLLVCTAALVVLALLRTPLRFIGALLIVAAIVLMLRAPQPDVLISGDGTAFAVRGADGRLAMVKLGSDSFALREWLAADADARTVKDDTLARGIRCDTAGCIGRLRDGSLVAVAKTIDAFAEDCRRAVLVVSRREAPTDCAARVIDREVLRRSGAMALWRVGRGFEITESRSTAYERPWARKPAPSGEASVESRTNTTRRAPRDATPHPEDLEVGD